MAEAKGQPERATRLLGAAEAILEASDLRLSIIYQPDYERIVDAGRVQLNEATFEAAWA